MGLAERKAKCRKLVRKYYAAVPEREWFIDQAVAEFLRPQDTLLDAGSGDTLALLNRYAPKAEFAVGIDVLPASDRPVANAAVTVGNLGALPFGDRSFDLIVSRSVVEHLADPVAVFSEVARVLKPGGRMIFTTPTKYYYSSLIAWVIPYAWKDWFMKRVFPDDGYDHFPVFYRANSRGALRRVAAGAGLRVQRLQALRHFPYYFLFSPLLFRLGMLYDWTVTALKLDSLQSTWLVVLERPAA